MIFTEQKLLLSEVNFKTPNEGLNPEELISLKSRRAYLTFNYGMRLVQKLMIVNKST